MEYNHTQLGISILIQLMAAGVMLVVCCAMFVGALKLLTDLTAIDTRLRGTLDNSKYLRAHLRGEQQRIKQLVVYALVGALASGLAAVYLYPTLALG